jgi:hypothetical protein
MSKPCRDSPAKQPRKKQGPRIAMSIEKASLSLTVEGGLIVVVEMRDVKVKDRGNGERS